MQGFPGPYTSGQWRNRHQQPYYFSLPIKCVGLDEPGLTYCTAVSAVWHHSMELELVQDLLWHTVSPTWISCKWCLTHVCKLLHISCVGFTHWLEVLVLMYSFSLCDLWDLIGTGLFLLLFMIEMNVSTSGDSGVRWQALLDIHSISPSGIQMCAYIIWRGELTRILHMIKTKSVVSFYFLRIAHCLIKDPL